MIDIVVVGCKCGCNSKLIISEENLLRNSDYITVMLRDSKLSTSHLDGICINVKTFNFGCCDDFNNFDIVYKLMRADSFQNAIYSYSCSISDIVSFFRLLDFYGFDDKYKSMLLKNVRVPDFNCENLPVTLFRNPENIVITKFFMVEHINLIGDLENILYYFRYCGLCICQDSYDKCSPEKFRTVLYIDMRTIASGGSGGRKYDFGIIVDYEGDILGNIGVGKFVITGVGMYTSNGSKDDGVGFVFKSSGGDIVGIVEPRKTTVGEFLTFLFLANRLKNSFGEFVFDNNIEY